MIKVRIYIYNQWEYMDPDVFAEGLLPAIPQKGEDFKLDEKTLRELENKARASLEIAGHYAPEWFQGKSMHVDDPKEENLQDLSFDDIMVVKDVRYKLNSEFVDIEIGSME